MPEVCVYGRIIHKIKTQQQSYDQLTLTRQNSGGIKGRRTRADEKCVECKYSLVPPVQKTFEKGGEKKVILED